MRYVMSYSIWILDEVKLNWRDQSVAAGTARRQSHTATGEMCLYLIFAGSIRSAATFAGAGAFCRISRSCKSFNVELSSSLRCCDEGYSVARRPPQMARAAPTTMVAMPPIRNHIV